ncbi:MAG: capsular biosynthesis protein [Firmicutes bacterium HGW-Firmicutes-1]|jgi:capsular exopolysaccharide synthesis family protein|nr:MAG: capsular biosynthesis protein [Firmicutes bacterium HGW-Firmicutes-1]
MMSQNLVALNEPYSMVSESYKMFSTNLNYTNRKKENNVILFTSTTTEEGKTISVANTAISYAKAGKKVLLIEGDLRKARIHEVFGLNVAPGLSDLLLGKKRLPEVVKTVEDIKNLHILTSGNFIADPTEILSSYAFDSFIDQVKQEFDIILIDAPPVLSVTDTVIISRVTDGVVLIIAMKETKKEAVKQAKKVLEKVEANILGVLMTKSERKMNKAYDYYQPDKKKNKTS